MWTGSRRHLIRTLRHPLAGHAGVLAGAQLVGMVASFATSVVAARLLGAEAFGVAALVVAFPSLVWSVVGVKSMSITTRYVAGYRARGEWPRLAAICKLGFVIDLAAAALAFLVVAATGSVVTARVLELPGMERWAILFAASLPFCSLGGTSNAILSCWGRFGTLAALQAAERIVTLAGVGAVLGAGGGVGSYVVVRAATQAASGVASGVAASRVLAAATGAAWWRVPLAEVAAVRTELAGLFGWNYLAATFNGVVAQAPLLVLGHVRGPVDAGYYRLATNLVALVNALQNALARVAYPVLSERWASGDRARLLSVVRGWALRAGLPLSAAALVALPLLAPSVPLVFGDQYAGMVGGTQLLMLGAIVGLAVFHLDVLYYAAGWVASWSKSLAAYAAAVALLAWPAAATWGFAGVAAVVGLGEALHTLAMLVVAIGRLTAGSPPERIAAAVLKEAS